MNGNDNKYSKYTLFDWELKKNNNKYDELNNFFIYFFVHLDIGAYFG